MPDLRPGPPSSAHARWFGCSTGSCSCSDRQPSRLGFADRRQTSAACCCPGSAPDPARFCADGARLTEVRQVRRRVAR
jgi:hypothetical protein